MKFFECEALKFLKKLSKNNSKEWFLEHKAEYEKYILNPSKRFVNEFGEELLAIEPNINAVDKVNGSLFRIYRDIRLSKDKTPLKSKIGIIFWRGSGARLQSSNFYLHFSTKELFVASGIRGFSRDVLNSYREYIKDEQRRLELHNILESIKEMGYGINDQKYKRYPMGLSKDDPNSYLFLNASLYGYKRFDAKEICSNDLNQKLFRIYSDLYPLFEWIYEWSLTFELKSKKQKSISIG